MTVLDCRGTPKYSPMLFYTSLTINRMTLECMTRWCGLQHRSGSPLPQQELINVDLSPACQTAGGRGTQKQPDMLSAPSRQHSSYTDAPNMQWVVFSCWETPIFPLAFRMKYQSVSLTWVHVGNVPPGKSDQSSVYFASTHMHSSSS